MFEIVFPLLKKYLLFSKCIIMFKADLAEVRCLVGSKLVGFAWKETQSILGSHLNVIWDDGHMALIIQQSRTGSFLL